MAERLTPQQAEAVTNRGGKLLVAAAAGSGKTKVLVDRLLGYLTDPNQPCNIDAFLIITYTKAAAAELRGKIAAKLSEKIAEDPCNRHLQQQMQRLYLAKISTVHAYCADLLREYAYLMDIPADFRVADENECQELQLQVLEELLDRAYENAENDSDFEAFINSQGLGRDDRAVPEIILQVYNSARCHLDPEQWLTWCVESNNTAGITDAAETVWGSYLIENLQAYLSLQIQALEECTRLAKNAEGMEKPAMLLRETVIQLLELYNAKSWNEILQRKKINYGRLTFSKKCTDEILAERIKSVRTACKKGLEKKMRSFTSDSAQVLQDLQDCAGAVRGLVDLVRKFSAEYSRRKKIRRVFDFGDLEHYTLDLLLGKTRSYPTAICGEIGERYREIMVDEYQDSNSVQDAIFTALTEKRQNCFMVGDVKQSIYQFRLADPSIFLEKYNRYAAAQTAQAGEGRKVLLSSNFRSSNGVLQAVNDVFAACMSTEVGGLEYNRDEMLHEGIPHAALGEPEVELHCIDVQEDTYAEEAAFVASRIRDLLDGTHMIREGEALRPIRPEDIVILLRSPGSVGGEFVYALQQRGIACSTGGSVDLLQTEEVTLLRSLLQVISNPLQDIPLLSTLMSRIFAFTADDMAAVRGKYRNKYIYEDILESEGERFQEFIALLQVLRNEARLYPISQLLQRVFLHTSMDSLFAAMPDGQEKQKNLHLFCQHAAEFEAGGRKDLDQFLNYLDTLDKKGLVQIDEQRDAGSVTIMSIHKSKGLEFPVVFLCGLSRNFNQESARSQVLCHKELGLGLNCVDIQNRVRYPSIAKKAIATKILAESISEEMRVLYVAMTRPKDRLIMTYAVPNIAADLTDIALRMDISGKKLMASDVIAPGEWVLQSALQRTEAGELFRIAEKPDMVQFREVPWLIRVADGYVPEEHTVIQEKPLSIPAECIDHLRSSFDFQYAYHAATQAPSKLTATQMKGRIKDQEAAENTETHHQSEFVFRKPGFTAQNSTGKEVGNAVHAVMQYICFQSCQSLLSIEQEIQRLVEQKLISPEQGKLVDPNKIAAVFTSDIGKKLLTNEENVLREFKFSLLVEASIYSEELHDEKVLLQGVVDCAIVEPDGIIVIDFKTDQATQDTVSEVVGRYESQINVYAQALERIYRTKVTKKLLYLFSLDTFVEV